MRIARTAIRNAVFKHWPAKDAKWIWLPGNGTGVNQYAEFRYVLKILRPVRNFCVAVSADSDYELWINGKFVGFNQYSDWPHDKTFNIHCITEDIPSGETVICVRVYYRGEDFHTYAKGQPGLILALLSGKKTLTVTNSSWRCRLSASYRNGPIPKVTCLLGFTVEYDASREDDWFSADYDDDSWERAQEICGPTNGYWHSLKPRPLPQLRVAGVKSAGLIAGGSFIRKNTGGTIAQLMMSDMMSAVPFDSFLDYKSKPMYSKLGKLPNESGQPFVINSSGQGKGVYLIFDLECEEAGLLDIDIEAPEDTIFDIGHGEHLDEMRVRIAIADRNFADRYISRQGRQQWFFPFRRLGCRFIQVHIFNFNKPIKIFHISLRPAEYPFEHRGSFKCSDNKLNDIWKLSRRTLELCAHEHYEDCPWREQALYAQDGRLQALYGYYAFGETLLPAVCWELLGNGLREDGLLELNAPARVNTTIPGFSLHWVMAVWELAMYSGDVDIARIEYPRICKILDSALSRMTKLGVVKNAQENGYWHFYEWSDVLAEYPGKGRIDAIYNLLLVGALRSAASIGGLIGDKNAIVYKNAHKKLVEGFHKVFWDKKQKRYTSLYPNRQSRRCTQLTQALALNEGAVPRIIRNPLKRALMTDISLIEAEYPSKITVYSALLNGSNSGITFVLDDIRRHFGNMIEKGATSCWETAAGAEAFAHAGSLCHAWSSVFSFISGAYILGIRPLEPGFKKFIVEPCMGDIKEASGIIPTPYGDIRVQWEYRCGKFKFTMCHPKKITPVFRLPKRCKVEVLISHKY